MPCIWPAHKLPWQPLSHTVATSPGEGGALHGANDRPTTETVTNAIQWLGSVPMIGLSLSPIVHYMMIHISGLAGPARLSDEYHHMIYNTLVL